jgi:glycosyltransferase involved in cell wall biosynthesis
VRGARAVIAIARYTAAYIREHAGVAATVIHPPVYGAPPFPRFGSFDEGYVLMVNPSIVKGISIFLALAGSFPDYPFAALTGWATTAADRADLERLPNVTVLAPVASIDEVLSKSRLLLMPSLWYEGFGLIAMEAMLRGLPVIASDAGGLVEATQGSRYVVPIRPIERFLPVFDEAHMPQPVAVAQDMEPWKRALGTLLADRDAYQTEADRSRERGMAFVAGLRASALEEVLLSLTPAEAAPHAEASPGIDPRLERLSPAKRALLMQRLKQRSRS